MKFATTDICDDHAELLDDGRLAVLPPVFQSYGQLRSFAGPAYTLRVHEDNALVRAVLDRFPGAEIVAVRDVVAEDIAPAMPESAFSIGWATSCSTSVADACGYETLMPRNGTSIGGRRSMRRCV